MSSAWDASSASPSSWITPGSDLRADDLDARRRLLSRRIRGLAPHVVLVPRRHHGDHALCERVAPRIGPFDRIAGLQGPGAEHHAVHLRRRRPDRRGTAQRLGRVLDRGCRPCRQLRLGRVLCTAAAAVRRLSSAVGAVYLFGLYQRIAGHLQSDPRLPAGWRPGVSRRRLGRDRRSPPGDGDCRRRGAIRRLPLHPSRRIAGLRRQRRQRPLDRLYRLVRRSPPRPRFEAKSWKASWPATRHRTP